MAAALREERAAEGQLRRRLEAVDDREDVEDADPVVDRAVTGMRRREPAIGERRGYTLDDPRRVGRRLAARDLVPQDRRVHRLRELALVKFAEELVDTKRAIGDHREARAAWRRELEAERRLHDQDGFPRQRHASGAFPQDALDRVEHALGVRLARKDAK